MTVGELVKKYIEENGYDGLFNDDCGCHKSHLFPCGEAYDSCSFGYNQPRRANEECSAFFVGPEKEAP